MRRLILLCLGVLWVSVNAVTPEQLLVEQHDGFRPDNRETLLDDETLKLLPHSNEPTVLRETLLPHSVLKLMGMDKKPLKMRFRQKLELKKAIKRVTAPPEPPKKAPHVTPVKVAEEMRFKQVSSGSSMDQLVHGTETVKSLNEAAPGELDKKMEKLNQREEKEEKKEEKTERNLEAAAKKEEKVEKDDMPEDEEPKHVKKHHHHHRHHRNGPPKFDQPEGNRFKQQHGPPMSERMPPPMQRGEMPMQRGEMPMQRGEMPPREMMQQMPPQQEMMQQGPPPMQGQMPPMQEEGEMPIQRGEMPPQMMQQMQQQGQMPPMEQGQMPPMQQGQMPPMEDLQQQQMPQQFPPNTMERPPRGPFAGPVRFQQGMPTAPMAPNVNQVLEDHDLSFVEEQGSAKAVSVLPPIPPPPMEHPPPLASSSPVMGPRVGGYDSLHRI